MANRLVAVLVGSLRRESLNRKLANAAIALAPAALRFEIAGIGQLPLYNQDDDDGGQPPPAWTAFRQQIKPADALLFVTPEYNRSVPGVLKNAIDVGSRPYGHSVFEGKPGAIISASPGPIGAFGANHHLRQSLVFLNVPAMQQPEAYIGRAGELFDANNELTNARTRQLLTTFMAAFAAWIETQLAARAERV